MLAYLQRQLEDLIISVTWGELKQEITVKGDNRMEKLVGKWVKRVWVSDYGFTKDRWYQVELEYTSSGYKLTNNKGEIYGSYPSSDNTYFDFANPHSYNPNKEILLSAGDVVTIDAGIVKYNLMKYLSVQSKLDHLKNYQSYIKIIIGVLKTKYDFSRNFNAVLDYLDLNHYKAGLVLEDITIRTQLSIPQHVVYINGEAVGDRAIITQAMLDEEVANKVSPNEDDKLCDYAMFVKVLDDNRVHYGAKVEKDYYLVLVDDTCFMCTDKWVTVSGLANFLTVRLVKKLVLEDNEGNKEDNLCSYMGLLQLLAYGGINYDLSTEGGYGVVRTRHAIFKCSEKWVTLSGAAEFLTVGQIKEFVAEYGRAKLELMQAPKEQLKTVPTTADNIHKVLAYNGWYSENGDTLHVHNKYKHSSINISTSHFYIAILTNEHRIETPNFDVFLAFLTSVAPLKELPAKVDY